ncbi:MAG: bifunctional UDP-N-acetylglucosamine diphosphorylase/glucosamine-1-phosphate N-acetyltransferase GlmU, partial [Chloroflexota bacterium]|nr:bifunctional UDP-N-acetylglucosamine diphosphorylase/glucosamine-1-phosphate N-acetyltransferase GlmU [Chloroflexota bacterium]
GEHLSAEKPVLVVGHNAEQVQALVGDRTLYVRQDEPLGTGHAVQQAEHLLQDADTVLILYGDTPLISEDTLRAMVDRHRSTGAAVTVLTFHPSDPAQYGRIVRGADGEVQAIVEWEEASPEVKAIREANSGILCFQADFLWPSLAKVQTKHGEYYLTDLVEMAVAQGRLVAAQEADPEEVLGVNNRVELAQAEAILRRRINERWMRAGVTLLDPSATYIDAEVEIGQDTVIHPNTYLQGVTSIGPDCRIGPQTLVRDSTLGARCEVRMSVVEEAVLEDEVDVGPFSHIRPKAHLDRRVHVGNFSEVKNARLGPRAKIGHFSYVGDAEIGAKVNIGAGAVTCNYDGVQKHRTTIGDGTFIGSGVMLVAPVRVGKGARIGAGAVVTHDVPPDCLAYGIPARVKNEEAKGP